MENITEFGILVIILSDNFLFWERFFTLLFGNSISDAVAGWEIIADGSEM